MTRQNENNTPNGKPVGCGHPNRIPGVARKSALITGGSINEAGFINSLKRKGFNINRCLSELIQNMIDAKSKNITIDISNCDIIRFIDDGNGMNLVKLTNMWDTYRENHSEEESGGVSGLGAKPSTLVASKNTEVKLFTKSGNDDYIKAIIPWDKIIEDTTYTGNITFDKMNESEINMFKKYNNKTGTIIQFIYNPELSDAIKQQFKSPKLITDITQRVDCIFSKFPCNIKYTNSEETGEISLRKYGYLNDILDVYYLKTDNTIIVFRMLDKEIIYAYEESEGTYKYYKKDRSGAAYRLTNLVNWREGTEIGTIRVVCGMRKDNNYFDFSEPTIPGASKVLLEYDDSYFDNEDSIKYDLWYPGVVRNSQYIGPIKSLPRLNPNSGRANGQACLKCHHIRTSIEYNVNSSQDNIMDEIMGIQENKNQLNSHNMDKGFLRLIEDNMKTTSDKIWKIFEDRVEEFNHVSSEEESSSEEEEEEEEEEDLGEQLYVDPNYTHTDEGHTTNSESNDSVVSQLGGNTNCVTNESRDNIQTNDRVNVTEHTRSFPGDDGHQLNQIIIDKLTIELSKIRDTFPREFHLVVNQFMSS